MRVQESLCVLGVCDVVSFYVLCCSVNGSVCFGCWVFVNCLVKQFAICLGVFVILLLYYYVRSYCIFLFQESSENVPLLHTVKYRRDVVFSQAVCIIHITRVF